MFKTAIHPYIRELQGSTALGRGLILLGAVDLTACTFSLTQYPLPSFIGNDFVSHEDKMAAFY
uniref:Uncharacterized protein n=1 Tax=Anguilla anguilla TaxID=7936 RepID=A0A0E9XMF6_ANGAN